MTDLIMHVAVEVTDTRGLALLFSNTKTRGSHCNTMVRSGTTHTHACMHACMHTQYQSKVWTPLLIQGFFFICTIF